MLNITLNLSFVIILCYNRLAFFLNLSEIKFKVEMKYGEFIEDAVFD